MVFYLRVEAFRSNAPIDTVILDKTGAVTNGKPVLTDVVADGFNENELLRLVGLTERNSEHPQRL